MPSPSVAPPPSSTARMLRLPTVSVAATFGLLDGLAGLSYLFGINIGIWHGAFLLIKLGLIARNLRLLERPTLGVVSIVGAASILTVVEWLAGPSSPLSLAAIFAFPIELALTLSFLNLQRLREYARGLAYSVCFTALIHLAMLELGRITVLWGRALYFGDSQPNLGGEIAAIGSIAAVIGLTRVRAFIVLGVLMADTLVLSSRSAMLTEAFCFAILVTFDRYERINLRRVFILFTVGVLVLADLALGQFSTIFADKVSSIFQLDSEYRGIATGASGRGALWDQAIQLFRDSPIFGYGADYFTDIEFIGPHNIVLYGLSQNGIMACLLFIAIIVGFVLTATRSRYVFVALLGVLPLFAFNDRYMSLNPYPFSFYVILAAAAGNGARGATQAVVRRAAAIRPRPPLPGPVRPAA